MTQETHAQEAAEIADLTREGSELLQRISAALREAAGPDFARYCEVRNRLAAIMADEHRRGFPLSPEAIAARRTREQFDRTLALAVGPITEALKS